MAQSKDQDQNPLEAEILREVAEEIKDEHFRNMLKKYGPFFLCAIFIVFLATAGFQYHKHTQQTRALEEAGVFQNALVLEAEGKLVEASDLFKNLGDTSKSGYSFIANLHYIDSLLQQNKTNEAISKLEQLIADKKTPEPLKNLAIIDKVTIQMDFTNSDPNALQTELAPLTQGNEGAWTAMALELSALISLQQNDIAKAKSSLQRILGIQNIAEKIRVRTTENLALINKKYK